MIVREEENGYRCFDGGWEIEIPFSSLNEKFDLLMYLELWLLRRSKRFEDDPLYRYLDCPKGS